MAALALYIAGGHEGGADQEKHRRFILPVIGGMKQRTPEHAIAQDSACRDQSERGEEDEDLVDQRKRTFEGGNDRIIRGRLREVFTIPQRTVHHAETSDASFKRVAAVAVL